MQVVKWSGKPITVPGWYSGIPIESYHSAGICSGPAVSSSDLRTCWKQSPAHMYARWADNPTREDKAITRAMLLGAAAHHLLLGEDQFKLKFVAQPLTYRNKVTAKETAWHNGADYCKKWNAQRAREGRTPVTQGELQTILAMSRSLALEPLVADGLLRGYVEHSGFAKDPETGLWLKVRPDVVPTHTGEFVDLKTTADVTTPALQSSIRSFGYHQQGALMWEVAELLKHPFESFLLMFIETSAPFCARAVPLTDDDLARGRLQNRAMIRKVASCITADRWPGPGDGDIRPLSLSNDERERIDARLKYEKVVS
jgi:hypothetical protein